MPLKFTNNGTAELNAPISAGSTTLTVKAGQGDRFPAVSSPNTFLLTLIDGSGNREIVLVTSRGAGSDSMTITRGQESTVARSFAGDDKVGLRLTAGALQAFTDDIAANGAALTTHKTSTDHDGRYYTEEELLTSGALDSRYNTKTNLQTSGQATIHAGNLTNKSSISHSEITDNEAAKHRLINDAGTGVTDLFSASKIISDLSGKLGAAHTSSGDHDGRYYTETELGAGVLDGRYYTETEVDSLLSGKSATSHTHTNQFLMTGWYSMGNNPYAIGGLSNWLTLAANYVWCPTTLTRVVFRTIARKNTDTCYMRLLINGVQYCHHTLTNTFATYENNEAINTATGWIQVIFQMAGSSSGVFITFNEDAKYQVSSGI